MISYFNVGLGLAIVRKLVKLMSGDIHVEQNTAASSGTKMIFYVDLDVDQNSPAYPILSPFYRQRSVYILEKHEGNRVGLTQILKRCGSQKSPKFFTTLKQIVEDDDFFKENMDALIINFQLLVENNEVELLKNGIKEKWLTVPIMILVHPSQQRSTKSFKLEYENITFSSLPVKFKSMVKFLECESGEDVAENLNATPANNETTREHYDSFNSFESDGNSNREKNETEDTPLIDFEDNHRDTKNIRHANASTTSLTQPTPSVPLTSSTPSTPLISKATIKSSESENFSPILGPRRTVTLPTSLDISAKRMLPNTSASHSPVTSTAEGLGISLDVNFGNVETDIPKLDVLVVEDNIINQVSYLRFNI
jgi:hypothetical protein